MRRTRGCGEPRFARTLARGLVVASYVLLVGCGTPSFVVASPLRGTSVEISGQVRRPDGTPLIGASVSLDGYGLDIPTVAEGRFVLRFNDVPDDSLLTIHIAHKDVAIPPVTLRVGPDSVREQLTVKWPK